MRGNRFDNNISKWDLYLKKILGHLWNTSDTPRAYIGQYAVSVGILAFCKKGLSVFWAFSHFFWAFQQFEHFFWAFQQFEQFFA